VARVQNTKYISNDTLNIAELLLTFRKRYKLILGSTILSALIAFGVASQMPDKYLVKARIQFGVYYQAVLLPNGSAKIRTGYIENTAALSRRLNALFVAPAGVRSPQGIQSISLQPGEKIIDVTAISDSNAHAAEEIQKVIDEANRRTIEDEQGDPQGLLALQKKIEEGIEQRDVMVNETIPELTIKLKQAEVEAAFIARSFKLQKTLFNTRGAKKPEVFRDLVVTYASLSSLLVGAQNNILGLTRTLSKNKKALPELEAKTEQLQAVYTELTTAREPQMSALMAPITQSDKPFNSKKRVYVLAILLVVFLGSGLLAFFLDLLEEQRGLEAQNPTS